MQEPTLFEGVLLAQIQVQRTWFWSHAQAKVACLRLDIALQRKRRHTGRQSAHVLAHDQAAFDQSHARRLAVAQHRQGRVAHFAETRTRPTAQRRQRFRQTHRVHHLRG